MIIIILLLTSTLYSKPPITRYPTKLLPRYSRLTSHPHPASYPPSHNPQYFIARPAAYLGRTMPDGYAHADGVTVLGPTRARRSKILRFRL